MENVAEKTVLYFGINHQLSIIKEELNELSVALSHYFRGRCGAVDEIIEETADVMIVLEQLPYVLYMEKDEFNKKVQKVYNEKIERLKKTISEKWS